LPAPFDTPSSVLGLIVIAGLVGHFMLVPRSAAVLLPAVPTWLLVVAYGGLTFAWSVDPSQSIDEFMILLSLVALYTLVMLMPVEERDVARIEEALVVGGAALGLYGIVLLLQAGGLGEGGRLATAGGVGKGIDPNITAATLILPLAIAVGRGVRARRAVARSAFWGSAGLIGAAIVLTGSRGGMLAAIAVLVVHAISGKHRRRIAIAGIGLAAVVGLTLSLAPENISRRLTRPSSSGRTDIWRTAMHKCDSYCWSGSGIGTFPTVYQDTLHSEPSARGLDRPFVAHSIWIGALIETGITGLLLLLLALALVARDLLKLPNDVRAAPLAGFVGVLIASTFLSTLGFKYFWMVMMYAGLTTLARERLRAVQPAAVRVAPVQRMRLGEA
jgi:hypothetical protein